MSHAIANAIAKFVNIKEALEADDFDELYDLPLSIERNGEDVEIVLTVGGPYAAVRATHRNRHVLWPELIYCAPLGEETRLSPKSAGVSGFDLDQTLERFVEVFADYLETEEAA